jgi:hypothetical protein
MRLSYMVRDLSSAFISRDRVDRLSDDAEETKSESEGSRI